jgi:putative ABC transport system permease protein
MRLPPMLASLTRHKLVVMLMIVSTALTCGVIANIALVFVHRLELISAPSGLHESSIAVLESTRAVSDNGQAGSGHAVNRNRYREDLAALRIIDGVEGAAAVGGLPFSAGATMEIGRTPQAMGTLQVTAYVGGPGSLETLGATLIQGRDFLTSEYLPADGLANFPKAQAAVISAALARKLFFTTVASGHVFYASGHPIQVVGVVDHMMVMSPRAGAIDNEDALWLPLDPDGDDVTFILKSKGDIRDMLLQSARAVLEKNDPSQVVEHAQSFTALRRDYFQRDASMISLLLVTGLGLLAVTGGGIFGLASFWVKQRTREIGIRRALGARRKDILAYFLIENFLIISGGVLVGCVVAYGLNLWLMRYFELAVIPPGYILVGAIVLWVTGQAAGMAPALWASSVPPVVATRSV